jgi:hypothetical protein
MYEPPLLDFLRQRHSEQRRSQELQHRTAASFAAGAPAFPASLASPPPGFVLPRQSINAVDPRVQDPVGMAEQRAGERALNDQIAGHSWLREFDRAQSPGAD